MKSSLLLLMIALVFSSCSDYQKLLKSDDAAKKYSMADSLYKQKKFKKSLRLMEQIVPVYRGKPQAEPLMFRYANTFYQLEDYYLAGYQFERFASSYPKSDSLELAAYRSAKSYYELSPRYSLDQTDTQKAMEKLQAFIDEFPTSDYKEEANQLVFELRRKLEKKDYEVAKQYLRISDYKASIEAYSNFISDHPGSKYRPNAFYERIEAAYQLAINSVPSKVDERLRAAKKHYDSFKKYYGESDFRSKADEMLEDIDKRLSESETETAIN
ncbi:outer membrane protein assembly factor BamD [Aureisphaera galaxeae]|uniref:outer membrane protein assembly factor BamD n=1 Tax=Aureisphaera galaxeae TaxID=1538023 RepID=UPI0023505D11|nr:outer membrane protein assembly factor BamD [Aureisphaera galaxeae]MDC8004972.1 outer membrane protein assembly factor BamD [Aureisphaera galaxeae]